MNYHKTPFKDEFGNLFRYRARIWDFNDNSHDTVWDVFLNLKGDAK